MSEVPYLRVVRGEPDEVELAAVVAVLSARSDAADATRPSRSLWASREALLRQAVRPRPGAWTAAARHR